MSGPDCLPCNIATALGITRNICKDFELDCDRLREIIDHPSTYTTDEAEKAIVELAERTSGEAKELMDCVVTMMRGGECQMEFQ